MAKNLNLRNADRARQDEFYTQLSDIENELRHYKAFFAGKTVFCNCDDPFESNFVKYFAMNFNALGLKKLIATCYATSPVMYSQLSFFDEPEAGTCSGGEKKTYKIEVTEIRDETGNGAVGLEDFEQMLRNNPPQLLRGDGDFRSEECIELLKEADVVVTNPPFSLFREYVTQLIEYNKKFLIMGNINAITYKDIFKLIIDQKIWGGYIFNKTLEFEIPNDYNGELKNGKKYCKVPAITWFTNIDIQKRHEDLILYKHYAPEEYPIYDNYNAINVDKTAEIPCDYDDAMGVPITFLDKYNPAQFEIIDAINRYALLDIFGTNDKVRQAHSHTCNINGNAKYFRIIIKRRKDNGN